MDDPTFTLEQAMAAQARLRQKLGLPPETFPIPALVGMLSDEIDKMRAAGHSDDHTAALIKDATGQDIDAGSIAEFHATSDQRQRSE